jgi:peptidoglycan/LPS O-acetylase OafA/YrhL
LLLGVLNSLSARGEAAGLAHAHTYAAAACAALTFAFAFAAYHFIEKPGRSRLRALFEGASANARRRAANYGT